MSPPPGKSQEYERLPPGGVYSSDLMEEAWLTNRSMSQAGRSLLNSALMKRRTYRDERLREFATLLGITLEELKLQIYAGQIEPPTAKVYEQLAKDILNDLSQEDEDEANLDSDES